MSCSSLGLTGLLADLLGDQDGQDENTTSTTEPPKQNKDALDDYKVDSQIAVTPLNASAANNGGIQNSVDSDFDGLLSGMNLPPEQDLRSQPEKCDKAAASSSGITTAAFDKGTAVEAPERHSVDIKNVPTPWKQKFISNTAALISLASDDNKEFRPYMEDGHMVVEPLAVRGQGSSSSWAYFGVYDGHGGRNEVDYLEKQLHDLVAAEVSNLSTGKGVSQALDSAFQKIDKQLAMLGAYNSGCTCTVLLLQRHSGKRMTLHVANVGDSRACILGESGFLRVTIDHRADDPLEVRRIQAEGCSVHNKRVAGKLAVSRTLGDHQLKTRGVSCIPFTCSPDVESGHVVVVASDGMWDAISDEESRNIVQECITTATTRDGDDESKREWLRDNTAKILVQRAKELGSRDNILVLVIFI